MYPRSVLAAASPLGTSLHVPALSATIGLLSVFDGAPLFAAAAFVPASSHLAMSLVAVVEVAQVPLLLVVPSADRGFHRRSAAPVASAASAGRP